MPATPTLVRIPFSSRGVCSPLTQFSMLGDQRTHKKVGISLLAPHIKFSSLWLLIQKTLDKSLLWNAASSIYEMKGFP